MNCDGARRSLKEYFEDLLAEPQRAEVGTHLEACDACRGYAFRFGSFAADLMRLAFRKVPFDLTAELLWELGKDPQPLSQAALPRPEDKEARPLWVKASAAAALAAMVMGLLFFSARSPKMSASKPAAPAPLTESADLGLALPEPADAVPLSKKPIRQALPVSLQPFHWHLEFRNDTALQRFLQDLHAGASKTEFEADRFVVVTADRKTIMQLVAAAGAAGARYRYGALRMEALPEFNVPVRVSIWMETDDLKPGPHPHFKFLLANRFALRDRLKEKGFAFQYETAEVWVLELLPEHMRELQEEALGTNGLQTDFSQLTSVGPGPALVPIYIEEG